MEMSLACEKTKKKATEAGAEGPVQNSQTCGWRGVQIKQYFVSQDKEFRFSA